VAPKSRLARYSVRRSSTTGRLGCLAVATWEAPMRIMFWTYAVLIFVGLVCATVIGLTHH
jgi:hypothetical protein